MIAKLTRLAKDSLVKVFMRELVLAVIVMGRRPVFMR